ncbi:MAG: KH domain-containing protein [bacterium]
MTEEFFDREFVEYVVKAIVNHPEDVRAERSIDERGVLITLYVNPDDMGYVIGKSGQTARSIRTLLKIVGAKNNARVNLKIYEPEGSRKYSSPAPSQAPQMSPVDDDEDIDTSAVDLKI